MDEFEDELFLQGEKKKIDLRKQRRRNQLKRGHPETLHQPIALCDSDGFAHVLIEQSSDRVSLDLCPVLDAQPSLTFEEHTDDFSCNESESIVDLVHNDSMDSADSGEGLDTDVELVPTVTDRPLHLYTDFTCSQFLLSFLRLVRSTNMCKSRAQSFLQLIQSIMPQPNLLPDSISQLLRDLDIDDNLFVKRAVCTSCKMDFDSTSIVACKDCKTTGGSSRALVYDADARVLLSMILTRLHRSIQSFRRTLIVPFDKGSNTDLPFGRIYQMFLQQCGTEHFVNLILHLDGKRDSFDYLKQSAIVSRFSLTRRESIEVLEIETMAL
jgi:hypothetical protein